MVKSSKKRGRPPVLGDHQVFTLRLPTELHRELRLLATVQGESLNDLLVRMIREWWKKHPERKSIQGFAGRQSGKEQR